MMLSYCLLRKPEESSRVIVQDVALRTFIPRGISDDIDAISDRLRPAHLIRTKHDSLPHTCINQNAVITIELPGRHHMNNGACVSVDRGVQHHYRKHLVQKRMTCMYENGSHVAKLNEYAFPTQRSAQIGAESLLGLGDAGKA